MINLNSKITRAKIVLAIFLFQLTPIKLEAQQPTQKKIIAPQNTLSMTKWFFGESFGLNLNTFQGNLQDLNENTLIPTAFTKGDGRKPTISIFVEYNENKKVGFILNMGYDNRGGKFKEVLAPCNCPANLTTNLAYAIIEPSIKFTPFFDNFFIYGGPTFQINVDKSFKYTQLYQTNINEDFGQLITNQIGGQIGIGYQIHMSSKKNLTQIVLSPFASYQSKIRPSLRRNESWDIQTIRVGIALKIGASKIISDKEEIATSVVKN